MTRILVVDDVEDIRINLSEYLTLKGYEVETASTSAEADEKLRENPPDLVLLDVGLPGRNGMALCRSWRTDRFRMPVIMLTARDAVDDRVTGLESGADDYVVKPFALREVAARIEAQLRRANAHEKRILKVGDLTLDLDGRRATRAGIEVKLNPTTLKILTVLMKRSPGIVSREALESAVWGSETPASDSLRSNLYLLRQAVDKPFEHALIKTHPGLGWSIEE